MTEKKTPPAGQRFSQTYVERGKAIADDPRMRRRLSSLIGKIPQAVEIGRVIEQELGIQAQWSSSKNWYELFASYALNDVLDIVTIAFKALEPVDQRYGASLSRTFLQDARRIFVEQNVHYTIDDLGGVHFLADKEFAHNRAAAIAALTGTRYANSLNAFDTAMASLSQAPPDGKSAIRLTFGAVEGLFRLMFPESPRLTATEADKLKAIIQSAFSGDSPALGAASKMLGSFRDWIDAAHFYRHESGSEAVVQPPIRVCTHIVS